MQFTLRSACALACTSLFLMQGAARAASAPAASAPSAPAVLSSSGGTPQTNRMKACNAQAREKGLHGPDRRAFMKTCLSGKTAAQH